MVGSGKPNRILAKFSLRIETVKLNDYHDGRSNEATKFPSLSTSESILILQVLLLSVSVSDELDWISK